MVSALCATAHAATNLHRNSRRQRGQSRYPECQSQLRTHPPIMALFIRCQIIVPRLPQRCVRCYATCCVELCVAAAMSMKPIIISDAAVKRFRDAASQFARNAAPRASRLLLVKDDIAALRDKGASFRTISALLKCNGIAASDTCVMRFCHRQLGEKSGRGVKRKPITAPKAAPVANNNATSPAPMSEAAQTALLDGLLSAVPPDLSPKAPTEGGPRVAKIEFAKPGEL